MSFANIQIWVRLGAAKIAPRIDPIQSASVVVDDPARNLRSKRGRDSLGTRACPPHKIEPANRGDSYEGLAGLTASLTRQSSAIGT